MQLGMIGLGRMGANIVRRVMRDGHTGVAYDTSEDSVAALEKDGAVGARSLEEFVEKLEKPRVAWVMIPAGITDKVVEQLAELMEAGDIIINGGNSNYREDYDRAAALAEQRHPLPRRRHQRRRVGPRARLLPDDRRRGRGGRALRAAVRVHRARAWVRSTARRAAPATPRRRSRATCTAARPARATS